MRDRPDALGLFAGLVALAAVAPVVALAAIAASGGADALAHALTHVVGGALRETAVLLIGVSTVVVCVGAASAWIVSAYDFPGRRFAETFLLAPLAMPVYLLAFCWLDLLHPVGPLQSTLRAALGIARPADLRLPDLRSLPGAIIIYGLALYPYVYVAARAAFLARVAPQTEAARLLGASEAGVFFRVALPMARPAIVASLALALMETLNDIGAAEFLSVNTITAAIYATWINRSDLPGAAQMAVGLLVIVITLVVAERWARGLRGYAASSARRAPARVVAGWRGYGLLALALAPPMLGFAAPMARLAQAAIARLHETGLDPAVGAALANTLALSFAATCAAIALAFLVVAAHRLRPQSPWRRLAMRSAGLGYAVPGTVLAIGLIAIFGALDAVWRAQTGARGLLLSASFAGIVCALVLRFLRLAISKIETGYERLPVTLDQSARMLGRRPLSVLRRVHWPLLQPAIAGAALLTFVDCMKELPATLLLRPLNFETLATLLYGEAARGVYENGAPAALLIVAAGAAPVFLLINLSAARPSAEPRRKPVMPAVGDA